MRDEVLELAARKEDTSARLNLIREYLQAFVLRSLHESEAFSSVAFVGGTALRFLENVPRFSEDLDFSVFDDVEYEPRRWLEKIDRDLSLAGFDCSVSWNPRKTVNVSWVRVSRLLTLAGLSHRDEQKISIKLEIDTRPPAGAELMSSVITRYLTFALKHYNLSSLMAGKIHALVTRPYPKGRDWYDLIWYRSRRPPVEPNLELLRNALDQTRSKQGFDAAQWRRLLRERLDGLQVEDLAADVSSFLERPADAGLLNRENLESVLR